MRNAATALGLPANIIAVDPTDYAIAITSPSDGASVAWQQLTATVSVTPSVDGTTEVRLFSGTTLLGTGTVAGGVTFTPTAAGTLPLRAEMTTTAGTSESSVVTITVTNSAVAMVSNGALFAPRVHLAAGDTTTTVLWTWADGSTSTSLAPTYTGPAGSHSLVVSPPNAVIEALNFGMVGRDNSEVLSPLATYGHTPTGIVSVSNLQGLPRLRRVLAENTPSLVGLDVRGLDELFTVETYIDSAIQTTSMTYLLVAGLGLRRYCIENRNLSDLDLSACPNIEDLRGRGQGINGANTFNVTPPTSLENTWHICKGQSSGALQGLAAVCNGTIRTPSMLEWWIWHSRITGRFSPIGTARDILAAVNRFSEISLAGITWIGAAAARVIDFSFAGATITSLDLTGSGSVTNVNFRNCGLTTAQVDYVAGFYDAAGQSGGTLDLLGCAAPTSVAPGSPIANLLGRGWTVNYAT